MLALDVLEEREIDSDLEIGGRTGIVPHARKAAPSFFNVPVEGKNLQAVQRTDAQVQRDRAARMAAWQDMTPLERSFVLEDEKELFMAWLRRRNVELDRMIAAGMLDRPDEEIDAHRKETEAVVDEFPDGDPVPLPDDGARRPATTQMVYEVLAASSDWMTVGDLLALTGIDNTSKVYTALGGLERQGLLVKGPSVIAESGRRMKRYAVKREA